MGTKTIRHQRPRPKCSSDECLNSCTIKGTSTLGFKKYSKYCTKCSKHNHNLGAEHVRCLARKHSQKYNSSKYNKYIKGDSCEFCKFVAVVPGQMEVDHIDGNHSNNSHSNLQTLCANCHRLKTWEENRWGRFTDA